MIRLFLTISIFVIRCSRSSSDDNATTEFDQQYYDNERDYRTPFLLGSLRDLLYNYSEDLYEFIKSYYGNDDATESSIELDELGRTEPPPAAENYKSFEECKDWWKDKK